MMHGMGRYDDEGREGCDGQDDHNGAKYGYICGQLRKDFMLNNNEDQIQGFVKASIPDWLAEKFHQSKADAEHLTTPLQGSAKRWSLGFFNAAAKARQK